jgi:hypothetical protein
MSDFGFKCMEDWNLSDQLPAEGGLGSLEDTSKPRHCVFGCLLGPFCI